MVLDAREIDALKRILFDYVEDLEKLAILAWLSAQPTALGQSLEDVTLATRLPRASVREALTRLVERGVVLRSGAEPAAYSYAPQESRVAAWLARIIEEYRADPLQVMGLMTKNSIERVKSAAVQTFVDPLATIESKKRG